MTDRHGDLVALTKELVRISSVSRDEAEIADFVEAALRANSDLETIRIQNNLVAVARGFDPAESLIVAGHLDTVPPTGSMPDLGEADVAVGVGAVDMKGGLAVMLALAGAKPTKAIKFVFYACEEISRHYSGLLEIERADPRLLVGRTAIVMEPTSAMIEAGCQGTAKFRAKVRGVRAHSARPWMGLNAIHRAHALLGWLNEYRAVEYEIDGYRYREALSAVGISGGIAGNVVPDEVVLDINYRFAPRGRDADAVEEIRSKIASCLDASVGDTVETIEWAPSAPPNLSNPVIAKLTRLAGGKVAAKLGWTDVAFFWERKIPACNFGPGDPLMAHTDYEVVTRKQLDEVANAMFALVYP